MEGAVQFAPEESLADDDLLPSTTNVELSRRWGLELQLEDLQGSSSANTASATRWTVNTFTAWNKAVNNDTTPIEDLDERKLGKLLAVFIIQVGMPQYTQDVIQRMFWKCQQFPSYILST